MMPPSGGIIRAMVTALPVSPGHIDHAAVKITRFAIRAARCFLRRPPGFASYSTRAFTSYSTWSRIRATF
jgi:hypothetical protein